MVFDLMKGGDMFRFLNKRGLSAAEAALSDEEARQVFTQVLSGIDCAHKHRIIHRDLKLENLL
jgi:serine/threonine protein kinase